MKKIKILFTIITAAVLLIIGCNKSSPPTQPPPDEVKKDTVSIAVGDVTHRSISVNVQCTMNNVQWKVSLYRTLNGVDTLVAFFPVTVKDTNIIDDNNGNGLLLDTEYKYYATLTDTAGVLQEQTQPITAKTLAPTSHNYTWQEYTFGDVGIEASALYDIWGTDENNVWAVGGVRINGIAYGVLYWNGSEWIPDSTAGGYAIYGFSNNDIWTVGGGVFHYDGIKWNPVDGYLNTITGEYIVLDSVLSNNIPYTSIWGTSSNNLYLGNNWGKIIHWDGSKAIVVYEGSSIAFTDISGYDKNTFIAVGSYLAPPSVALKYNSGNWSEVVGIDYNLIVLRSALSINNNHFLIGGSKNYELKNNNLSEILKEAPGIIEKIRMNRSTGEIVAVGDGFTLLHYNGVDWKNYSYDLNQGPNSAFYGVYITKNNIFTAGYKPGKSVIFIGTKH